MDALLVADFRRGSAAKLVVADPGPRVEYGPGLVMLFSLLLTADAGSTAEPGSEARVLL